jgi:cytochrome c553
VFHIKNNIAAGLTLVALLATTTALAATKSANSAPPKAADAAQPKVTDSAQPQVSVETVADSAEDIKMRSGSGNPVDGKEKSELCQSCHGKEGISLEPLIPKLAGQYANYIAKQLRNFQSGARVHQIMAAIAETISNEDLADITAYFASQTKMKGDGSAGNPLGKKLFLEGDMTRMMVACVNCHGVNGKGKTPRNSVFPVIGGQHKDYLRGQLINFRDGDRANSPGGVMNIITQKMTDAELEALVDYVSRL